MFRTTIEGAPIALAPDLSCVPVVGMREAMAPPAISSETSGPTLVPAEQPDAPRSITLEPLALILAHPGGVERHSLFPKSDRSPVIQRHPAGDAGANGDARPASDCSADRMTEAVRQACVDAVFGVPTATAGGFRFALRRATGRLWPEPGDTQDRRLELLGFELLGEAVVAGGSSRPALGMSTGGVYH